MYAREDVLVFWSSFKNKLYKMTFVLPESFLEPCCLSPFSSTGPLPKVPKQGLISTMNGHGLPCAHLL